MFEGMEDYNFGGPKRKNYGCLILIGVSVLIFLLGVLIGWMI
jgi:hypothetical protein